MKCTLCDICESKENLTIAWYGSKALLPLCLKCYQTPDRDVKLVEKLAENRNNRDEAQRIIAKLDAENERLREALEHYTDLRPFACDSSCWCANPNTGMTARQALEARDE